MKTQMLMGQEWEGEKSVTEIFISRFRGIWLLETQKWLQKEKEVDKEKKRKNKRHLISLSLNLLIYKMGKVTFFF